MKGTYTIDPLGSGTTNFVSFQDAIQQLKDSGIVNAVVFNVADGNYYGNLILDSSIKGVSASNTITFQSNSMDSSKVILQSPTSFYTIYLTGCKYINFKWLTILSNSYSSIYIGNHSSYNKIENCIIRYYVDGVFLNSSWVSNTKFNVIRNNHIVGLRKGAGIEIKSVNFFVSDLTIANNIIDSCGNSIYVWSAEHMSITGNLLYGPVEIDLTYSTGAKDASILNNNFIWVEDTNQNYSALYLQEFEGVNVFNNSIYTKNGNAFWSFKVLDNSQVKNNIFYNAGQGTAIEADDATLVNYDHNDIYSNGKVLCINGNNKCATLSDWQKSTKMDAHSVSTFPYFKDTSTGNLHLTHLSPRSLDSGIYISADSLDIDGEKRNKTRTWLGADEYVADTMDVGVKSIVNPLSYMCGDSITGVRIEVHNFGLNAIGNFNVFVLVSGATHNSSTLFYKDTLGSGKDTLLDVGFAKPWNSTLGGIYEIKAFSSLIGDQFLNNDTTLVNVKIKAVPNSPNIILKGKDTLVSSYTGDSCQWYRDSVLVSSGKCEYIATKSGKYQVMVFDSACPSPMSAEYNFTFVGIGEEQAESGFSLYPNPVGTALNFTEHPPSPFKGGLAQNSLP